MWTERAEKAPWERNEVDHPWASRGPLSLNIKPQEGLRVASLTRGCKDAGLAKGVGDLCLKVVKAISCGLPFIPSHHENLFFLLLVLFLLHFCLPIFLAVLSQVKPQTGQGPSGSPVVTRSLTKGSFIPNSQNEPQPRSMVSLTHPGFCDVQRKPLLLVFPHLVPKWLFAGVNWCVMSFIKVGVI